MRRGLRRGYFLTGAQKKDLLLRGRMSDDQGRLYDVWIVPGYEKPLTDGRQGWHDAGDSLADYGRGKFYSDIEETSRDVWRTGTKETLKEFALRGTRRAWQDSMNIAAERTERRVFGWWLAYPWGFMEALAQTFVRLGGGIPVGLGISASAYTIVPVAGFAAPVPKAVWYAAAPGLAAPLTAAGWNTIIAPPLALLGEQPAPERADGFWMTMVCEAPPPSEGLDEALESVTAWRNDLLAAVPTDSLDATTTQLDQNREIRIRQLQAEMDAVVHDTEAKKQAARAAWFQGLLVHAGDKRAELRADLQAKGFPANPTPADRAALETALTGDELTAEEARALLDVVLGPANGTGTAPAPAELEKTDPVKRSLEILGDP